MADQYGRTIVYHRHESEATFGTSPVFSRDAKPIAKFRLLIAAVMLAL
jgi:hypothetical protein